MGKYEIQYNLQMKNCHMVLQIIFLQKKQENTEDETNRYNKKIMFKDSPFFA